MGREGGHHIDRATYFERMRETSKAVESLLLETVGADIQQDLKALVCRATKESLGRGGPLRPALFRFAYEAAGGSPWSQVKDCAAAFELLNLSSYSFSSIIDNKAGPPGASEKQRLGARTVAGLLQLGASLEVLTGKAAILAPARRQEVLSRLFEVNRRMCEGVFLDASGPQSLEDFDLDMYLARCAGMSGSFTQTICEVAGLLAGADDAVVDALGAFGHSLGTIGQMVNDVGDYIPPEPGEAPFKTYKDQFADLRGGTITYPSYVIFLRGDDEERAALGRVRGNFEAVPEDLRRLARAFVRTEGVEAVKALTRPIARDARKALDHLERSEARSWLKMTLLIANTNFVFKRIEECAGLDEMRP